MGEPKSIEQLTREHYQREERNDREERASREEIRRDAHEYNKQFDRPPNSGCEHDTTLNERD